MGGKPQLDCRAVKSLLKMLGFSKVRQDGSHEHYQMVARGHMRTVTVDCPKAPFSHDLVHSMARQAGLKQSEFYAASNGMMPSPWP
ncbi:type II toxin-antitoxin system HicA family toxin [Rhodanobacter sp. OR87]|uniref:type II toxin-antitoxin system HicA family toxin n=1 Tax=Rhodanobacter sp. OR87 TaxID=1076523 RepID=UPI0009DEC1C5|nr:type II toxin-antitoxin system HicA family toxin [Rhodanobacter sp. OR87]